MQAFGGTLVSRPEDPASYHPSPRPDSSNLHLHARSLSSGGVQQQPSQLHRRQQSLNYSHTQQLPPFPLAPPNETAEQGEQRRARQSRKPSPGLAARLKALGFGNNNDKPKTTSLSPALDRIGRIPEDHIRQLDYIHRTSSAQSGVVERRGRAWSNTGGRITPQVTGGSYKGSFGSFTSGTSGDSRFSEGGTRYRSPSIASSSDRTMATYAERVERVEEHVEMDSHQKYRLPEHVVGNGTKTLADTKQPHLELVTSPPPEIEIPPPAPIAKDTPPGGNTPAGTTPVAESLQSLLSPADPSYFNPFGLQRAGSIYTLSRVSFANQLAQLTSLQLPDAELLSTKVSAIPNSKAASKALMGAAEQIRSWIQKASEVISGLDGEDDVEWAAAGGREGLAEVDNAITRFEQLINIYVSAIESLQNRPDIATVTAEELQKVVLQVETILMEWDKIKKMLKGVKNSVEIAMEWEELWNTVLGDIGNEMDVLKRLVFEMEEKRHKSLMQESNNDGLDINELETIVEETPPAKTRLQAGNRFSVGPAFPMSPNSPNPIMAQDDSSLLALFARMQPLRASLDFLPMRLSSFHSRASDIFPTACEELETRRTALENSWKALEKDAESLRKELGEDRWVLVFRGAGRQAQKMYESVERSVTKLGEAVEGGVHLNNPATMGKKIESYEAKKMHYGPAIERVLSIIERGVKDRLTVNGEILRLHSEMQNKWDTLKDHMRDLDLSLDEIQADKRNQQLRDSISSMVSNDRSTLASYNGTPGSSPASSVVMTGLNGGLDPKTPLKNGKLRGKQGALPPSSKRHSSYSAGQLPQRTGLTRLAPHPSRNSSISPSPRAISRQGSGSRQGSTSRQGSATPTTGSRYSYSHSPALDGRPRWNSSVNIKDTIIGHNFKPLSLTTPSPHARTTPGLQVTRSSASESKIPLRSPLSFSRENTASPAPHRTPSRTSASRLSYRERIASPGPYSQQTLPKSSPLNQTKSSPGPYSQHALANSSPGRPRILATKSSMSALTNTTNMSNRRSSMQPKSSDPTPMVKPPRPVSSLASSRRVSLLPQPRGRSGSNLNVEDSQQDISRPPSALRRGTTGGSKTPQKPWRG